MLQHTAAAQREPGQPQRLQQRDVPLSRAQLARNQRNRARNAAAAAAADDDEHVAAAAAADTATNRRVAGRPAAGSDSDDDGAAGGGGGGLRFPDGAERMGAKKRAKLEAKAEKRMHRESELEAREERQHREELLAEERRRADEKEREEERRQEEAERLERERKEREEHEEYLRMKAAFSVEEEGFDDEEQEADDLLQRFVQHIRAEKVVLLEDLSRQFKLKTPACIERIQELRANGTLTGVLDDRGKFVYISAEELRAVATFIRQRGRISITELAESSNKLISMAKEVAAEPEQAVAC